MKHNHIQIFNTIAPYYGLFFNKQVKSFRKMIENIDLTYTNNVIDIGAGNGALANVLYDKGLEVTILDASSKMLEVAKKKLSPKTIKTIHADITKSLNEIENKTYDLSIASFVAHGLKPGDRIKMYQNMKRITKDQVILIEHSKTSSLLLKMAEFFEGGEYFNFINNIDNELKENFREVKEIQISKRVNMYILKG